MSVFQCSLAMRQLANVVLQKEEILCLIVTLGSLRQACQFLRLSCIRVALPLGRSPQREGHKTPGHTSSVIFLPEAGLVYSA